MAGNLMSYHSIETMPMAMVVQLVLHNTLMAYDGSMWMLKHLPTHRYIAAMNRHSRTAFDNNHKKYSTARAQSNANGKAAREMHHQWRPDVITRVCLLVLIVVAIWR